MKKNGMTLPEIMITVAIIGIISAIIIPMANNSKPNETKIAFLKNYDELTRAVHELVNDSSLFPVCQSVSGIDICFENTPLLNGQTITLSNGTAINSGRRKFCELLANKYDVNYTCSNTALPTNGRVNRNNDSFSFTTKTGESYRVRTRRILNAANKYFRSEILIDVNGDGNGNDCMYANNCQDPDTFRLWVTGDGEIYVGDRAGEYYLNTRQNPKSKNLDIRDNSAIAAPNSQITP